MNKYSVTLAFTKIPRQKFLTLYTASHQFLRKVVCFLFIAFAILGCSSNATERIWFKTLGGLDPDVWTDEYNASYSMDQIDEARSLRFAVRKSRLKSLDDAAEALGKSLVDHVDEPSEFFSLLNENNFACKFDETGNRFKFICGARTEHQYNVYGVRAPDPPFEVIWRVEGRAESNGVVQFIIVVQDPTMNSKHTSKLNGYHYGIAN